MRDRTTDDRLLIPAALLLVVALLFGGGGSGRPIAELSIETVALATLAWAMARPLPARAEGAVVPLLLLALVALLIALQLMALPPDLWRALRGRALAVRIADRLGTGGMAYPVSLDPAATRRSLAALLPAAAMLVLVIHMDQRQRFRLVRVVIVCAVVSLLLAAMQLLSVGAWGSFYADGHVGYATGPFANRNHQATFLLIGIALTGALPPERSTGRLLPLLLALGLGAGVVATTSRAGFLLLPIALLPPLLRQARVRWTWLALLWPAGGIAAVLLVRHNAAVGRVIDRLHGGNMGRLRFWQDSWTAIADYWPVGSGFGTFATIFRSVEPLDHLGPNYVNHAHNDYLELMLEGGLPAMVLLVVAILWAISRCVAISRLGRDARNLAWASAAGLLVLLLHSLVDYPTRILAIQLLAAMLAGFLTAPAMRRPVTCHPVSRFRARYLPSTDKADSR